MNADPLRRINTVYPCVTFTDFSASFSTIGNPSRVGQALTIQLVTQSAGETSAERYTFDNVRLEAVGAAEPASLALVAPAALFLSRHRFRRRV